MRPPSRLVAVHQEYGIFLGIDDLGVGWWARQNPLGISVATTFEHVGSADAFFSERPQLDRTKITLHAVDTLGARSASLEQMIVTDIPAEAYGTLLVHQEFLPGVH